MDYQRLERLADLLSDYSNSARFYSNEANTVGMRTFDAKKQVEHYDKKCRRILEILREAR